MLKKLFDPLFFTKLILGLIVGFTYTVQAATFYVSSSSGNDANDGQSEATAWQSISKVNGQVFATGSVILFKRGDIFRGEISLKKSHKTTTFGAYGTGENPIISGSVHITGWIPTSHPALSKNVYEADVSALPLAAENGIQYLFVNSEMMTIARYPNVDSPTGKNWLKVGATAGTDGFTDPVLAAYAKPDGYWTGAILRIRNYSWTLTIRKVTGYNASNGKIVAKGLGNQLPEWGYFLDDKLEELDYPGEWFYDANTQKIYLYPKTGIDPNTVLVEGATYNAGMNISSFEENTVVENLTFRHYLDKGAHIGQSDKMIVRNCRFENNKVGLTVWNNVDLLVTNNVFDHNFHDSIRLIASEGFDVKNSVAEKNIITNTAMYPGYGQRYQNPYEGVGISILGKAYTVRKNLIENTCWVGVGLGGNGSHLIENNIIRKSLAILNDGGAVIINTNNNVIRNNILTESIGNVDESNGCSSDKSTPCMHHTSYGMGVGANSKFKNNTIEGNVIANNPDMGIRLNSAINTVVRNNIVYNNDPQIAVEDKLGPSNNNIIEGNIIYSLGLDQIGLSLTGSTNHGKYDNNYYGNPYNGIVILRDSLRYSFSHWQKEFPQYDQHSKAVHPSFPEYTVTQGGANLITNSSFDTGVEGWSPLHPPRIYHDPAKAEMDGGSLRAEYTSTTGFLAVSSNMFSVVQNQQYRLKFSFIANGFGRVQLRLNHTLPTHVILEEHYFAMDTTRRDYEFIFHATETTDSAKIFFVTTETSAKNYWLDNVTFEPVVATLNKAQEYSKLFVNSTESPQVMDLGGINYVDLDGQPVTNLTLEPFTGKILIYAGGTPLPPPSQELPLINNEGGKSINSSGQFGTSSAKFLGGSSTGADSFTVHRNATAGQNLTVKAKIAVASADIGQKADLLFVVGTEPPPAPYDGGIDTDYVAINQQGNPLPVNLYAAASEWMPQLSDPLVPDVTLQENMEVNIGTLPFATRSMYYLFVGYRLADGTIIYTPSPMTINVQ